MVQKKFPIIPVVLIGVGLMAIVMINMKSHPKDPSLFTTPPPAKTPPKESAKTLKGQISKSVSTAISSKGVPGMPGGKMQALHGGLLPFSDNGMVVRNVPKYKPQLTDSSINGGWYTSDAPQSFPKKKAPTAP